MEDPTVLAKREAGRTWCEHATRYSQQHGGKAWRYLLIPDSAIAENKTLPGLASRYA